ncbi:MAG: hypothetical protein ACRDAX_03875, partial [Propionibacteriaceae bacterium]
MVALIFLIFTATDAKAAGDNWDDISIGVVVNPDGMVVGTIGVGGEGPRQPVLPPVAEITQPYLPGSFVPEH